MRKMATVRKIDSIRPIEGADAIECAVVGGWTCVIKKGDYLPGDLAIYCEIDSFIPSTVAPFLTKPDRYPKEYEGVKGERLKTARLRGQLSQGLLLPITHDMRTEFSHTFLNFEGARDLQEGDDVSELLGIKKYEAPLHPSLIADVKGLFPSRIPKTDQERIQNLKRELEEWRGAGLTWEVTEKLDGCSVTVHSLDGEIGVCSRNLELKFCADNSLWKAIMDVGIDEKLKQQPDRQLAIQGELIGFGIQGNKYKLRNQAFYVFDIYDIKAGRYFTPKERHEYCNEWKIPHVPVFNSSFALCDATLDDLLRMAEAKSVMGVIPAPEQEGLVFKCNERPLSFKAISNKFLLKGGE